MRNVFFNYAYIIIVLEIVVTLRLNAQADEKEKTISEMPAAVYEKIAPVTVEIINNENKPGTGIIIGIAPTSQGDHALILTACHVVSSNYEEDAADPLIPLEFYKDIHVKIESELSPVPAKVRTDFVDRANDIAIIITRIPVNVDQVISYKEKVSPGQSVAAFGFPQTDEISQTVGTIIREEGNYFVFDARIAGGNSGGPLVDDEGDMVGLTTFKRDSFEGYALNINLVATVVNNWLEDRPLKQFWQKVDEGSFLTKPYVYIPGGLLIGGGIFFLVSQGKETTGDAQTPTPFGPPPDPPGE